MVNNAIYGMTGGQMAPTTLIGMKSSTSPYGRSVDMAGYPLDLPKIIAQLEAPVYVASVSVDSPQNIAKTKKALMKAFKIQQAGLGFAFVSILSTCPTNWGLSPVDSLTWLRENMMPVYELGELKVAEEVKDL